MSEDGFNYPLGIKMKANYAIRFDTVTGDPLRNKVAEFVVRTDREQKQVRSLLVSFSHNYAELKKDDAEGKSKGFSKIRELTQEHQLFDFMNDPLAPNTIVVTHTFEKTDEEDTNRDSYFYISDRKDKDGVPLVYKLRNDRAELKLPEGFQISLLNAKTLNTQSKVESIADLFSCTRKNHPDLSTKVEIWKEGKSLKSKTKELKDSATRVFRGVLIPKPVSVGGKLY